MVKLALYQIFQSIDGEFNGFKGAGQLATFIRLSGCNLRCKWCDTAYAQGHKGTTICTAAQIAKKIPKRTKVTITGGEPFVQRDGVEELVHRLLDKDCKISIETNGSLAIPLSLFADNCFFVRMIVDYKLPSSGMEQNMYPSGKPFIDLRPFDVVKFVIADYSEYEYAKKIVHKMQTSCWESQRSPTIVFSPAITDQYHYTGWPANLAKSMIADQVPGIQYSLQIHKVLWPYAMKER